MDDEKPITTTHTDGRTEVVMPGGDGGNSPEVRATRAAAQKLKDQQEVKRAADEKLMAELRRPRPPKAR